jgi:DNA-binding transcriptional MocR family regulator
MLRGLCGLRRSSILGSDNTIHVAVILKMTLRTNPPAPASKRIPKSKHINLLKGWPNESLLPPKELCQAASNILSSRENDDVLFYGPDEGYEPLREQIAQWLNAFYQPEHIVDSERITISGGASQNLACVLQIFTDPIYTRNVFMVAPTYYLACRIFTDAGFDGKLRAVPEDKEGIELTILEGELERAEKQAKKDGNNTPAFKTTKPWRKIYKYIIYCVPTFANPSGRVMSLHHRQQLVRLARKYDALVVTDDVYDMLAWPSSPSAPAQQVTHAVMPRIVDIDATLDGGPIDNFGHAMSNGSFSKIVAPGCRTGWAEATPSFSYGLSQTGSSRSGGAPSQLVASFISDMLAKGVLQRHILEELQPAYAGRYHSIMKAITEYLLPLGVTVPQPNKEFAGGYFIWLTLPKGMKSTKVYKRALAEENLTIISGPQFTVDGDDKDEALRFESDLRLCYAWEDGDAIEEGVRRLSHVIQKVMDDAGYD